VLAVGRFTEKKGLRYAIQGVKLCPDPVTLGIVGYGELEAELRAEADAPGPNRVEFLGRVPHQSVLERMMQSDVVLLPSVVAESGDMEGIPVALMEAMARGCLAIATRHSGIPELITTGESGILVAERDSLEIAEALSRIARGGYDVPSLRRNARASVERQFDGSQLDRELLELTRALALQGEAPPRGSRQSYPAPSAPSFSRS
jgi:colanic acid/amylovoran biosynthesis glycosyltransferase